MSGKYQGKESGQNWEGSAAQSAQSESGKIQPKQLLILLVLSLSLAIIVIDATIVIVALPQIQKDFSISLKDLEWITSLYALIFGSFLLSWGKLSDEFGRKLIFMAGISTFIVGSIIDGFSLNPNHDVHWQIAKRSFRHMGRDRRSGSGSRSSPRRLLYNIHILAMGVLHQYSNRDRRPSRGRVSNQRDSLQGSKIHNRLSRTDLNHHRLSQCPVRPHRGPNLRLAGS